MTPRNTRSMIVTLRPALSNLRSLLNRAERNQFEYFSPRRTKSAPAPGGALEPRSGVYHGGLIRGANAGGSSPFPGASVANCHVAKWATNAAMPNENAHAATIDQKAIAIGLGMGASLHQVPIGKFREPPGSPRRVHLFGRSQSRRIGPFIKMGGGVGLPRLFQKILSLASGLKLRSLAADFFRERREAVFHRRYFFHPTSFRHSATPCSN
jgi:hypothetical protein